jgi:lipopolysaccharide export system protein LptC
MRTIYFLLAVIVVMAIMWNYNKRKETFEATALDIPNKCYSCEKQYPAGYEWMGQKSKCFSCEAELFAKSQGLPQTVFNAKPIRYYTQPKLGYMA